MGTRRVAYGKPDSGQEDPLNRSIFAWNRLTYLIDPKSVLRVVCRSYEHRTAVKCSLGRVTIMRNTFKAPYERYLL